MLKSHHVVGKKRIIRIGGVGFGWWRSRLMAISPTNHCIFLMMSLELGEHGEIRNP